MTPPPPPDTRTTTRSPLAGLAISLAALLLGTILVAAGAVALNLVVDHQATETPTP